MDDITPSNSRRSHRVDMTVARRTPQHPRKPLARTHHRLQSAAPHQATQKSASSVRQSSPSQHEQPTDMPRTRLSSAPSATHTSTHKPVKKLRKPQLGLAVFRKRSRKYAAGESGSKSKLRTSKRARISNFAAAMFVLVVGTGLLFLFDPDKAAAGTPNMQGPKTATASGDCTNDAGTGTVAWTSPGNAFSSNDTYATAAVNGTTSNYIKCVNYGFSIPTSATVNGIIITVERKASGTNDGGVTDAAVRAVKGGVIGSTDKSSATAYTTSDVSEDHGTSSELWGTTWTPADINGATFGAAVAVKKVTAGTSLTASVDLVTITVHYTISSNLDLSSYRWFENNGTLSSSTYAQTWGGATADDANAIALDSSGNIYVIGATSSTGLTAGLSDQTLVKYNSSGVEQWSKTWGGTGSDYANALVLDGSNNIYVAGYTTTTGFTAGGLDQTLVKYNSSGVEQWSKTWGGTGDDQANDLALDGSGNIYVVGFSASTGFTAGSNDQTLVKYNSSGVEQWSKTWGGTGDDQASSLTLGASGSIYVVGSTTSSGFTAGFQDQTLVKYNSSGVEQWTKTWGGSSGGEIANDIVADASENLYVVGGTDSTGFIVGDSDQTLIKYNSSGVEQWTKTWGAVGGLSDAYGVSLDTMGNIYVVGVSDSPSMSAGNYDQTLVKYNTSGIEQWSKTWGGTGWDSANDIAIDSYNNIYLSGFTSSSGITIGGNDQTLLKFSSSGTIANCVACVDRTTSETDRTTAEVDRTTAEVDRTTAEVDRATSETDRKVPRTLVHCGTIGSFMNTWGGTGADYGDKIVETSDGGYIVAGSTDSYGAGSRDQLLVKYNSSGVEQWAKTWGGTSNDYPEAVVETSDGGFVMAGWTSSTGLTAGANDQTLVKYDSSGVEQWSKTWGGANNDIAYDMVYTSDGGFVVTGYTQNYGPNASANLSLVKYDSSGVEQWSKTWSTASVTGIGLAVVETSDGGFAVAANVTGGIGLIKFDSSGVEQWSKTWGGAGNHAAYGLSELADGSLVVTGHTDAYGLGSYDHAIIKFDSSGVEQWSKAWGSSGWDSEPSDPIELSDGSIIVVGHGSVTGAGGYDQTIVKFNSSGVEQWSKTIGNTGNDTLDDVILTSDGRLAMTGDVAIFGAGSSDQTIMVVDTNLDTCGGICNDISMTETNIVITEGSLTMTEANQTVTEVNRTMTESNQTVTEARLNETLATVADTADVGAALNAVAQDTATTAPAAGTPFRLRFTAHITNANMSAGDLTLKLQYAVMFDTCDTAFGGETYYDVGAATPISYYDNTGIADRFALTSNANDPVHSGHSNVLQQYGESAGFGVGNAVTIGSDGLWDVALTTVSPAGSTTYCIRAVTYSGNLLGNYTVIPAISTPNAAPSAPTLQLPANGATATSLVPEFRFASTDGAGDYLRYKIEVCSTSNCSSIVRTIDQTSSQTGWLGQSLQNATAYSSGATITQYAIHQYQPTALTASTQYWWRAYAIDPGGTNSWSDASAIWSFTTGTATPENINVGGGTTIYGGTTFSTGN